LVRRFANTEKNPTYETFNLSLQRRIKITEKTSVVVRFDVGVGAPQFGQRRGFYGTVAYDF
jgi:hypothetical protein